MMLSRICLAAVLLITAAPSLAQTTAATISGTVKDTSGASVPDALIAVTSRTTHQTRTIETNESGIFVAPDIEEGSYDVSVEKAGFKKSVRSGVAVNPQDRLSLGEMVSAGGCADRLRHGRCRCWPARVAGRFRRTLRSRHRHAVARPRSEWPQHSRSREDRSRCRATRRSQRSQ